MQKKKQTIKTKTKTMKAKDLTSQQRIEILEDVLKKLESGDTEYGLCDKITRSTFELFHISDIWGIPSKNIIPILTLENASKVTDVVNWAFEESYWWDYSDSYDFENRIKFVKWMINEELKNNINKQTKTKTMKTKQTPVQDTQKIKRDASGKIIIDFSRDANSLFQRIKKAVRFRQVDPEVIERFYKMDKETFQLLFI